MRGFVMASNNWQLSTLTEIKKNRHEIQYDFNDEQGKQKKFN